ncbi:transcriptional regulator-domain-containing protein [Podospora didyma]|uniref:Transcriptional regulator-domain-containing protein n=1 Tax=Podospora didyma TaxID=330526 RepID=A0AAE0N3L0_9PEZI|nr:transcriptional regulator-domain-containing protein [Podospora didyma]
MSRLARSARPLLRSPYQTINASICAQCRRSYASSPILLSGHNKWSKIKHDKAAKDIKKAVLRIQHIKNIQLSSKLYGADTNLNSSLVTAIAAAKKASIPKQIIEAAIARGQGKSLSGSKLEPMTFEFIVPPSIAVIVDVETDQKNRMRQDMVLLRERGSGVPSQTKFLFTRLGRVVFAKSETVPDTDIMDYAIEAGAEDIEYDDEGNTIVWTETSQTSTISKEVANKFGLQVLSSDVVWCPNPDTKVEINNSKDLPKFIDMLQTLREHPEVQSVWSNVTKGDISDEDWATIQENLDV